MKTMLIAVSLVTALHLSPAQELLPRKEALKYAFFLGQELSVLQNTPIPTDVDLKHVVAMRHGEYGALILPEAKLTAESIKNAGETVLPLGQLWLHRLTPIQNGEPVEGGKLREVWIDAGDESSNGIQCVLGVKKSSSGGLDLLVYGKGKEPVAKVPLQTTSGQSQVPVQMNAEHGTDNAGRIILKFLGQFQASIPVTRLDP
ncbi:MAG TPA: hypothetical protein VN673_00030 [Clostridia bacterium]|nr:hypothetical protein [Clostridia bacterium]